MSGSHASAGGAAAGGGSGSGSSGETAGRHKSVIVHPLVLLSVTDHSYREHREMNKRVLGVLLGEVFQGRVVSGRGRRGAYQGGGQHVSRIARPLLLATERRQQCARARARARCA